MGDPAPVSHDLYEFPAVETHLIRSEIVAQTYQIRIMQPPKRGSSNQKYAVVYATDGNATFDMLKGISQLLQSSDGETVPFILVSIGYPGDSPVTGEILRGRDFTFDGCPDFCRGVDWDWGGVLRAEAGGPEFGGARDFQRFIGTELIPFINERYPTRPDQNTYFGHSAGGGFGLFTMLVQTGLFANYIVSSPILTYHGVTADGARYSHHDFMLDQLRQCSAAGSSFSGTKLCLSVGSEEEYRPVIANWRFTSSAYRAAALLRELNLPGLTWSFEVFSGETHISAWPIAFMHGLRRCLGTQ